MVDKNTKRVICIAQANGRQHDFRLFKESKTYIHPSIEAQTDTGYQGIIKLHANTKIPKKKTKKKPLSKEDKLENQKIASSRVLVENVIRSLKIFRIMAEKYRNRRKRYNLRINLIAAIYNYQL